MASVYEMARQKIAARAPIAVFQVERPKKKYKDKRRRHDLNETKEYRQTRNRRWYENNTMRQRESTRKSQYAFLERWGFFPSCWYYWTAKLKKGEITPGQLPKKFITIYTVYRKDGRL